MMATKDKPKSGFNSKTLDRKARVKMAKKWAASISTDKKIKAYKKYFGVDKLCAAKELALAGVELKEKYAEKWATRHERKALAKKQREKASKSEEFHYEWPDSDEYFYYIAGHTQAGFAYGITWEQAEVEGLLDENQ